MILDKTKLECPKIECDGEIKREELYHSVEVYKCQKCGLEWRAMGYGREEEEEEQDSLEELGEL